MLPDECVSKRAIRFKMVDFPHPDGPSIDVNDRSSASKVTFSRTRNFSPLGRANSFVTLLSFIAPTEVRELLSATA